MRPRTLTEIAERVISDGENFSSAVKEFIDEYRAQRAAGQNTLVMYILEPRTTGVPVQDVYLAGLAEYLAFLNDVPPPDWVNGPSRFLQEPLFLGGRHSRAYMLSMTTFSMRKRLLFCGVVEI